MRSDGIQYEVESIVLAKEMRLCIERAEGKYIGSARQWAKTYSLNRAMDREVRSKLPYFTPTQFEHVPAVSTKYLSLDELWKFRESGEPNDMMSIQLWKTTYQTFQDPIKPFKELEECMHSLSAFSNSSLRTDDLRWCSQLENLLSQALCELKKVRGKPFPNQIHPRLIAPVTETADNISKEVSHVRKLILIVSILIFFGSVTKPAKLLVMNQTRSICRIL